MDDKRSMKKGSGEVLNALILIVIMIAIASAFVANAFGSQIKRHELLLYETEVLIISNSVSILQTSLGMTWMVSTEQALFKTADDSIGCELLGQKRYWYKTDIERTKSLVNEARMPTNTKINSDRANPKICIPQDVHVIEYLDRMFSPYRNIVKSLNLNGVSASIDKITNRFDLYSDGVGNKITEEINAVSGKAKILNITTNNIFISTDFASMIDAGKYLVNFALALSDATTMYEFSDSNGNTGINPKYVPDFIYKDWENPSGPDTKETYESAVKSIIRDGVFHGQNKNNVLISSSLRTDYFVPDENQRVVGPQWQSAGQGLILHYSLNTRISDVPVSLPAQKALYQDIVNQIVAGKNTLKFGKHTFKQEEIVSLINALIQFSSDWDRYYVSQNGGKGLMQINPSIHTECSDNPAVPKQNLFDPENNINCGANIVYDLLNEFSTTENKDDFLRLVVASYIDNRDVIHSAVTRAKTDKWDIVKAYLKQDTRIYVTDIMSYYGFYLSDASFSLKFDQPVTIKAIASCFELPRDGIIIVSDSQQVKAAFDGELVEKVTNCFNSQCNNGHWNSVLLKHDVDGETIYTFYGNLRDVSSNVLRNINKGQAIGNLKQDTTGNYILYFSVKKDTPINPCNIISCNNLCDADVIYDEFLSTDKLIDGKYYYYESPVTKKFVPRNVVLPVKLEDYIFAIDCVNDYKTFTPSGISTAPYTPVTSTQLYRDWIDSITFTKDARPSYNNPAIQNTASQQTEVTQNIQNLGRSDVLYRWGALGFDMACLNGVLRFCSTNGVEPPPGLQQTIGNKKAVFEKNDRSEEYRDVQFPLPTGSFARMQLQCTDTGFIKAPSTEPI